MKTQAAARSPTSRRGRPGDFRLQPISGEQAATGACRIRGVGALYGMCGKKEERITMRELAAAPMHFRVDPRLRPTEIAPPPPGHKPPRGSLIERINPNGVFVLYDAVYGGLLVLAGLYGLHLASMN